MTKYKIKPVDAPIWFEITRDVIQSVNLNVVSDETETYISYDSTKVVFEEPSDLISTDKILIRKGARIKTYINDKFFKAPGGCRDYDAPNSCYEESNTCIVVVLSCHYCCYDEVGFYKEDYSEVCGVCIGVPF